MHNVATAALSQSKINLISRRTQPPWWREHSPGHLTCAQEPRCDLSFLLLVVLFLVLCPLLDHGRPANSPTSPVFMSIHRSSILSPMVSAPATNPDGGG